MDSDATGSSNVVYGKILMILKFGSRKREGYGTENGGGTGLLYGADSRWEDLPRRGQSASDMPSGPLSASTSPYAPHAPLPPVFLWRPPRAWALMAVACRCLVRVQQPCKLHLYRGRHRGSPS